LVVAQSSSEIPEGLMNNPVYIFVIVVIIFFKFLSVNWMGNYRHTVSS
jgi:hypothetical protein